MNIIHTQFYCSHVSDNVKHVYVLLNLEQSQYAKIQLQDIPSIDPNVLE